MNLVFIFHAALTVLMQFCVLTILNADIDEVIKQHQHNVSTKPQFCGDYFVLVPSKIKLMNDNYLVVQDIDTVWDVQKFKHPRIPAKIGIVEDCSLFNQRDVPRCIHMPIKLPNSGVRIPKEYKQFTAEIQKILNYEYSANTHFDNYYAYLTVDVGFVPRETTQRIPGPHVDGLPRDRKNPQTVIDHAYLVTNAVPTRFYFQSFDMTSYDLDKHHFFAIFRALADETQSFLVKPFEINLMNAYSVHTPEVAVEDTHRTILRLEFSVLDFDRQGNSINPAFANDDNYPNYPFTYIPRPIPEHLVLPTNVFQNQPISNKVFTNIDFDHFGRERLIKELRLHPRPSTLYRDLENVYSQIEKGILNGIVITYQHTPMGFIIFEEVIDTLFVHMLYTHEKGMDRELTIYMINTLKSKGKSIVFVEDYNNREMIPFFERASKLANLSYSIDRENKKID
jgi:hypothetical protein